MITTEGLTRLVYAIRSVRLPVERWSPLGHGYWPIAESKEPPHTLLVARQMRWGHKDAWSDLFRRLEGPDDGDLCVVTWREHPYQLVRSLCYNGREDTGDPVIDGQEREDRALMAKLRRVRIESNGAPECASARRRIAHGLISAMMTLLCCLVAAASAAQVPALTEGERSAEHARAA